MIEYTDNSIKKNAIRTCITFFVSIIWLILFGIFTFFTDCKCNDLNNFGKTTFYLLVGCAGAEMTLPCFIAFCREKYQICSILIVGVSEIGIGLYIYIKGIKVLSTVSVSDNFNCETLYYLITVYIILTSVFLIVALCVVFYLCIVIKKSINENRRSSLFTHIRNRLDSEQVLTTEISLVSNANPLIKNETQNESK